MKIKISKNYKIGLIFVIIIIISILSYLLYLEVKHPGIEEQKVSLYSYNNSSTVDYKVFLKPNILYEENVLGKGCIYITEFIDKIEATFNYSFIGEGTADVKGEYDIIARVEGIASRDKEELIIWEKDFVLLPKRSFTIKNNEININQNIEIKLDEYSKFARQVIETSKVNTNIRLNIVMGISINGDINNNTIEDKVAPSIVIPLDTNYFQILGSLAEEKPGTIEETKQIQLPLDKKQVIFYGIILGVLVIALVILIFFTKGIVNVKDPYEKLLKQIFKKHGDRLVALNSELTVNIESAAMVKSIDDLVRIADEVGKPIMYKYSSEYKEINKFYLINEDEVYILDTNSLIDEIESKKRNNKVSNEAEELMDKVRKFKSSKKGNKEDNNEESKIES